VRPGGRQPPIDMSLKPLRSSTLYVFVAIWALLALGGYVAILAYATSPSDRPTLAARPLSSPCLNTSVVSPTLHIFFHPKCPCSMASVAALESIIARCPDRDLIIEAHLLVPDNEGESFASGEIATALRDLQGQVKNNRDGRVRMEISVQREKDCAMAIANHVNVSGHTVLVQPDGKVGFSGGLTAERGCRGDSEGVESIVALLHNRSVAVGTCTTPIFGCALR
jgi:hypothetical protein